MVDTVPTLTQIADIIDAQIEDGRTFGLIVVRWAARKKDRPAASLMAKAAIEAANAMRQKIEGSSPSWETLNAQRAKELNSRVAQPEREVAQARLGACDSLQARVERLEKALRFYADGMECGITKDHFGDRARAALAADGETNDRD